MPHHDMAQGPQLIGAHVKFTILAGHSSILAIRASFVAGLLIILGTQGSGADSIVINEEVAGAFSPGGNQPPPISSSGSVSASGSGPEGSGSAFGALAIAADFANGGIATAASASATSSAIGTAHAAGSGEGIVTLQFTKIETMNLIYANSSSGLGSAAIRFAVDGNGPQLFTNSGVYQFAAIPGDTLQVWSDASANVLPSPSGSLSGSAGSAVSWGTGPLLGDTPQNPILASTFVGVHSPPVVTGDDSTDSGDDIASSPLVAFPAVGAHGYTSPAYVSTVTPGRLPASPANPDFFYSPDNAFKQITIPPASAGSEGTYHLLFHNISETIVAGTTFDFTTLFPGGVPFFYIWPDNPNQALPPVVGFEFATEGLAEVTQGQHVPEPSNIVLAAVGFMALAIRRFGHLSRARQ
jgi:hypothetical protein